MIIKFNAINHLKDTPLTADWLFEVWSNNKRRFTKIVRLPAELSTLEQMARIREYLTEILVTEE